MKEGWKIVKLGDVCEIRPSRSQNFKKLKDTDKVSFLPMEDLGVYDRVINASKTKILKEVSGSYTYFENGDVLLAKVTPCFENGKLGIAYNLINGIGFGSSEYIVFRPSNIINSEYVYYNLANAKFREGGKRLMLGACGLKRLSKDYVNNYIIPLPPLEEQHRIVGILDAAFAKIDALKKNAEENLANAKALFQQVLAQELQPKEGWVEKKLGEFGDFKNGMNFAHNERGTEIHMLGVGNFGDLFFINDVEKLPILSLNKLPSEDYLLKDEDIVFVRSNGNKQLVGRSLVVYPKGVLTTFSGFCIRFRKRIDDINIIFLTYYLKTKDTRKKLFGNGANISNLNQKMLQDLLFVYPSLEEQHRIVRTLDTLSEKCRRLEQIAQQTIRECDALKQSILRRAFSGEL